MAENIPGRPVITAAELDEMTPERRRAVFEASVVRDLSHLPSEYVARLRAAAEQRIAELEAAPGSDRGIPHAS